MPACHSCKPLLLPALIALTLGGCATKEFVQQEVGMVNNRINDLSSLLGNTNRRIDSSVIRIETTEKRINGAEQGARELLLRADQTQADLHKTGQRIDSVAEGLKAANQRIDSNGIEITRAHQRLDRVDNSLAATQQQTAGALALIGQTETRLVGLESRVEGLKPVAPPTGGETPGVAKSGAPSAISPAGAGMGDALRRLEEIAAHIANADKRIDANSQALTSASTRISDVEASLADTRKRTDIGEAGLGEANRRLGAVQGELARVEQRVTVNTEAIAGVAKRVDGVQGGLDKAREQIVGAEQAIQAANERLTRNEATDAVASATAREALDRAIAAGKLAEGKLVYETSLTEELTGFAAYQSGLSDEAKQALKQLAEKLLAQNQNVFIEIQGHSDTSGKAMRNVVLARERAEAVHNYLHKSCGIPIHRLGVVSYGGDKPVADNATKEGRSKNRRVALVVLK